jgi:hypothetical protein
VLRHGEDLTLARAVHSPPNVQSCAGGVRLCYR